MFIAITDALTSKWAMLMAVILGLLLQFYACPMSVSHLWALSLIIKKFIMACLPFIMFGILFSALVNIGSNGIKIIILLGVMTFLINFFGFWFLYPVARFTNAFEAGDAVNGLSDMLIHDSAWSFDIPVLVGNGTAVALAVIVWLISRQFFLEKSIKISKFMNNASFFFLQRVLGPMISLFVLGFISNLNLSGFVLPMFGSNLTVLSIIIFSPLLFVYIVLVICNGFKEAARNMLNMMPAVTIAFTTMSSSLAFPKTCEGLKKNKVPDDIISLIPGVMMPSTLGDCFTIPTLIFFILSVFGMPMLSFSQYFIASIFYSLYKYSNCCIPAGTIMCVMPVISNYCGFTDEMCDLIMSMSLVFDSFTTAANAMGQGTFGIAFNRFFGKLIVKGCD
ncbi:cation:dicarboxylate symporter family transporter [Candidatus Gromoviella agglomerans]|uniref:cation:dicarboxylate symporter family transporter n=1 Tax=Candidatus Gromoviella agglomerans TaxID=2806609 RepID=UPI001E5D66B6|nr:cation:dicarboxylase symporter family transporter [Candidatus Gromoviella agglomerans]UFX98600.1 Sodium:dicarboxylate symporter family protein [Candidatus Gromoviella agglomerans]